MLKLSSSTIVTTDSEILETVAAKVRSYAVANPPECVVEDILKLMGPIRLLSLITSHDEDFVRGYLRQVISGKHRKVKHGQCAVCGHIGADCTGEEE